jgi:ABC-type dipeptide/oligopeptide/nickel transport system permease subunit
LASVSLAPNPSAGGLEYVLTPPDSRRRAALWTDAMRRLARNRLAVVGGVLIMLFLAVALLAPALAPYPFDGQLFQRNLDPNPRNLLGTDDLGRDLLSRMIFGARISLLVGVATQLLVLACGIVFGCISAYFGRVADSVIMRVTDVVYAFPTTLFAIVLISVMGRQVNNIVIAIAVSMVPNMVRLVRSSVLDLKELEFIEAARSVGASNPRILLRHILPNILSPVIVATTFGIPAAMMAEASLSFIGLGIRPPIPSWGLMVSSGFGWIRTDPWLALVPAVAISLTLFAFNFLGDGLRDALDPKSLRVD